MNELVVCLMGREMYEFEFGLIPIRIGEVYRESSILDSENFSSSIRDHPERFAIIVHGWRESCKIKWAKMLIENLNIFRGGLILCMDYSYFASEESYFRLVNHFDGITTALKIKLTDLESAGYDANNGYLFGFSFGGQVVVEAGRRFGFRKLKEIDSEFILSANLFRVLIACVVFVYLSVRHGWTRIRQQTHQ